MNQKYNHNINEVRSKFSLGDIFYEGCEKYLDKTQIESAVREVVPNKLLFYYYEALTTTRENF